MRLIRVENAGSPDTPEYIRTTALIALEGGDEFRLWVDVPRRLENAVSFSGNPWVVAMLPIAAGRGEDISLSIPVDALLLENLRGVISIWRSWYPEIHEVAISCPLASFEKPAATKTAAFYSGGIDSYFSIARRMPNNAYGLPIVGNVDDLLTVWGFDVRFDNEPDFRPLADILDSGAHELGLRHVVLRTNLRTAERITPFADMWRRLSHGAGLAFVGLILEREYREVVIGSSHTYGHLFPWGSDPMLDPLYSTSALAIVHDGSSVTRVEKTDLVGRFPPAYKALHVCLAHGTSNCSHCEKCYRTMMTLDLLGHREATRPAFDWTRYDVSLIRRFFVRTSADRLFRNEIVAAASARGRSDIVKSFRYASWRSALILPLILISEWLMKIPGIWRVGLSLKNALLGGPIRKI